MCSVECQSLKNPFFPPTLQYKLHHRSGIQKHKGLFLDCQVDVLAFSYRSVPMFQFCEQLLIPTRASPTWAFFQFWLFLALCVKVHQLCWIFFGGGGGLHLNINHLEEELTFLKN